MAFVSPYNIDSTNDTQKREYETRVLDWLNSAYEEGCYFLEQAEEVKNVEKYIGYLMSKQWPKNRPAYKAAPVDNRLWKLRMELISFLTDIKPTWDVKASNKNYDKTAEILNDLTASWWLSQDVDMSLAYVIDYAALTTGYGRLGWNSSLCSGAGDMELRAVGPTDLLPLRPEGLDIQSCQGLCYRSMKPLNWFRSKYGKEGWDVKPDSGMSMSARPDSRPSWIPNGVWTMMSPGMRRVIGTPSENVTSVFPVAEYREFWVRDDTVNEGGNEVLVGDPTTNWSYKVKPGEALYPRGRLLVTGGGTRLLHDGPNPFWHGRFPFEKLCLNPVPYQWYGPSEYRVQLPLQDVVNQIMAGVLDMVKKAVNPALIAPENAFSSAFKQSIEPGMPGAKLFYNQASATAPSYASPPNLPSYVIEMMSWAMREMDNNSGMLDLQSIAKMGQIPAADTLEQLKEGQQTIVRLKGRAIEIFLRNIGTQGVSNFMQFYTVNRRLRKLGLDGLSFQDYDFDPGNLIPAGEDPREFAQGISFSIKPGSILNSSRVEKAMMFMNLRRMGDMDRRSLFDALELGGISAAVEKNLKEEGADLLLQMVKAKSGKGGSVPTGQLMNAMQGSDMGGSPAIQ